MKIIWHEPEPRASERSSDITVTAFPNPVKDKLNFNVQSSQEALFSLQIYDVNGKLLNTKTEFSKQGLLTVDLSDLPSGIYYYSLSASQTEVKKGKIKKI